MAQCQFLDRRQAAERRLDEQRAGIDRPADTLRLARLALLRGEDDRLAGASARRRPVGLMNPPLRSSRDQRFVCATLFVTGERWQIYIEARALADLARDHDMTAMLGNDAMHQ